EASHDRRQPQSPSDYRQSSERGRARACVLCQKNGHVGNPTTTARRHYILCLEAVRSIDRAKCLISLKATGEQETVLSTVGRGGARRPRPGGGVAIENVVPGPGPPARNIRA